METPGRAHGTSSRGSASGLVGDACVCANDFLKGGRGSEETGQVAEVEFTLFPLLWYGLSLPWGLGLFHEGLARGLLCVVRGPEPLPVVSTTNGFRLAPPLAPRRWSGDTWSCPGTSGCG